MPKAGLGASEDVGVACSAAVVSSVCFGEHARAAVDYGIAERGALCFIMRVKHHSDRQAVAVRGARVQATRTAFLTHI